MTDTNELIREAKKCNSCLDWHKHCESECCRIVFIHINPNLLKEKGDYLIVKKLLTKDLIWYYKLREVIYAHGIMKFPKKNCVVSGNRIAYLKSCKLLSGNLCKNHPDRKPIFCQQLILKTAEKNTLTDNCMFKYQLMEE